MRQYPVFLSLKSRQCLVVGDGPNARFRATTLVKSGALVTLLSNEDAGSVDGLHQHLTRLFHEDDPANFWLVIAATKDEITNAKITTACEQHHTLCFNVTNQLSSTFVLPAIIDRSPLLIALSSGGAAPALVLNLKRKLDKIIPESYSQVAKLIEQQQEKIKGLIPKQTDRARFWRPLFNGLLTQPATSYTASAFEQSLNKAIDTIQNDDGHEIKSGFVSLVGAGPGDPDLLTLRALRLVQAADVLVYDRLVSPSILEMRRKDAQLLYAGKAKSEHTMPQGTINQRLVDLALQGHHVVRLKGGDPFIFGRGGEEIDTLAKNQIPFQVVPGITAAAGCAAYAGIPLTHRDHAQSCVFLTGHLKNGEINLNWQDLRDPSQTIVIYMGLTGLADICKKLINNGRNPNTPAALIEQGTTPNQRVHASTLERLAEVVAHKKVRAPTLVIIGSVVSLHETLRWYHPDQSQIDTSTSHFDR